MFSCMKLSCKCTVDLMVYFIFYTQELYSINAKNLHEIVLLGFNSLCRFVLIGKFKMKRYIY